MKARGALWTPLCDLLGIRHALLLAGMAGGPNTPELVSEVSRCGGLGVLGVSGMTVDAVARATQRRDRARRRRPGGRERPARRSQPGDGRPRGDRRRARSVQGGARAAGTRAPRRARRYRRSRCSRPRSEPGASVVTTFEDPSPAIPLARRAGIPLLAMVTSPADAERAVAAGADGVIAQGTEAGGHRSAFAARRQRRRGPRSASSPSFRRSSMQSGPTRPSSRRGGIMDGRGIAAAHGARRLGRLARHALPLRARERHRRLLPASARRLPRRRHGRHRRADRASRALDPQPLRGRRRRRTARARSAGAPGRLDRRHPPRRGRAGTRGHPPHARRPGRRARERCRSPPPRSSSCCSSRRGRHAHEHAHLQAGRGAPVLSPTCSRSSPPARRRSAAAAPRRSWRPSRRRSSSAAPRRPGDERLPRASRRRRAERSPISSTVDAAALVGAHAGGRERRQRDGGPARRGRIGTDGVACARSRASSPAWPSSSGATAGLAAWRGAAARTLLAGAAARAAGAIIAINDA